MQPNLLWKGVVEAKWSDKYASTVGSSARPTAQDQSDAGPVGGPRYGYTGGDCWTASLRSRKEKAA